MVPLDVKPLKMPKSLHRLKMLQWSKRLNDVKSSSESSISSISESEEEEEELEEGEPKNADDPQTPRLNHSPMETPQGAPQKKKSKQEDQLAVVLDVV